MQWGDLSFQGDYIGDYISEKAGTFKFINLKRWPVKITERRKSVEIDSRFAKVKTLSQIFAREKTP